MKALGLILFSCVLLFSQPIFAKEGTVLVMFGTTVPSAQVALQRLEDTYAQIYAKKGPMVVAYTSDFIRKKLKKQGKDVFSVQQALAHLAAQGVQDVRMQSFHMTPAAEYMETQRVAVKYLVENPQHFTSLTLGDPLLVSEKDMQETVQVVLKSLPTQRKAEEAVLLMGHGNDHGPGDLVLKATAQAFAKADKNIHLACVEGALTFDAALKELQAKGIKTVWLMPFMLVAGDHAVNDLVGKEADSWASQLTKAGFEVQSHVIGLGQVPGIGQIFLRHTKDAYVELSSIRQAD